MSDLSLLVDFSVTFALIISTIALLITIIRVIIGPTLADRVLALDMLVAIAIGFIAVLAIKTGYHLYIDVAIALSLVGFLATIAFARLVLARGLRVKGPKRRAKLKPVPESVKKEGSQ